MRTGFHFQQLKVLNCIIPCLQVFILGNFSRNICPDDMIKATGVEINQLCAE